MIEFLLLVSGILLILLIFQDILFTTYSMEGGGKMTEFFLTRLWIIFLWISGYNGRRKLLSWAGMFMMISLIFLWGIGLWAGVTLLFASSQDSILQSETHLSTDLWEKIYFSGYVLTTMGLGDYIPANVSWGILSAFFSLLGLVFITLMVSYALPVLSNVIVKKQLSLFTQHLGETPIELLLYFWNGKDFSAIKDISKDLQQKILSVAKSYKAYPVLHYFHANKKKESLVITFCILDEALSILETNVSSEQWDEKEVIPLRKALSCYLETMRTVYNYRGNKSEEMPLPDLQPLKSAHIKLVEKGTSEYERKQLWGQLLQSKGWSWKEVYSSNTNGKR